MKLSKLVDELLSILLHHGDIDVMIIEPEGCQEPSDLTGINIGERFHDKATVVILDSDL